MPKLTYKLLTADDYPDVLKLLKLCYAPNFALIQCLGNIDEDVNSYFALAKGFLKQENSFGAFNEDSEIVGVVVNVGPYLAQRSEFESNLKTKAGKAAYAGFTSAFVGGSIGDVSHILGTDKYWEMKMGTINPKYKGLGIMQGLGKYTYELARKKGIKKLIAYHTYNHTDESLKQIRGWYIVKRINLLDYTDAVSGKKIFAGLKPPHTSEVMMVRDVI
ncbi:uncharacterized protein LOC120338194 [Styela clava]